MYHPNGDQEIHPENYVLTNVSMNVTEDECHDLLSKPRQTQTTIGMYLKKKKGADNEREEKQATTEESSCKHRASPKEVDHHLEHVLKDNKGFWVDKPTLTAPLIHKLREEYTVELPKKDPKKGQGIFFRPDYLESEYLIKLGQAGLLYPDEEITDSEEEIKPDETMCLPLRKKKYKICDPCKEKPEKKKKEEGGEKKDGDKRLPFKKIITGCQCNYYGEHNKAVTVWDVPFRDHVDMIRNHEMDKYLRPFKTELFNKNYKENPPVFFSPVAKESKRTFPHLMLSNL